MLRKMHIPATLAAAALAAMPLIARAADDHAAHAINSTDIVAPPGFLPTAVWNLILFLALLVVLSKFVWPHILNGLNAREQKIRAELAAAEQAAAKAGVLMAEYERKVAEAHAQSRQLVDQARADAEQVRARVVAETEADLQKMRQRATAEIDAARQQAVQDLYARSATLAVAVAQKILQRQIDASDTQTLVDQSLAELDKLNAAG